MRNDADHEMHELVAFTIPPEETRSVDELVMLPEGELFTALPPEPALVLLAPPGEEATAVVGDVTGEHLIGLRFTEFGIRYRNRRRPRLARNHARVEPPA
ncbi:MAG: hypothetical protein ACRD2C_27145 [Acidimicrobiales bacterium]